MARKKAQPNNGGYQLPGLYQRDVSSNFEPSTNVVHKPATDVTLEHIDKLFAWFQKNWPREELPNERRIWWQSLWSFKPSHLGYGCKFADTIDRWPTLEEFREHILSGHGQPPDPDITKA